MVAAEYGYTDDVLLRIPLRRLRQMIAAILDRQHYKSVREWEMTKWQTRSICQFVSLTIETTGGNNPIYDAACKLGEVAKEGADENGVDIETKTFFESLEDAEQADSQDDNVLDPIGMNVAMFLDNPTGGHSDA